MILRSVDRRGNVAVVTAVCLIAIVGAVALSLDGGQQLDKRRQCQAAADAAALSAVSELYANWWNTTPRGTDTADRHAEILAYSVAAKNGFTDGVNGVDVTVNIPPASGPFTGLPCYAEVLISVNQERFFSRIFSNDTVPIGARAVARGLRSTVKNGIIVLDPDDKAAMAIGGGATVGVTSDAAILVNSADPEAVFNNGNGSTTINLYDGSGQGSIDVVGTPGYVNPGGGTLGATVNPGVDPTPDPLRFLPPPDPSTMVVRQTKKLLLSSATNITIKPGLYIGGISISGKGNVTMEPGIYYMQGGGFNVGAQGSLWGEEVMIYNAPLSNSDTISITGSGAVHLTPPSSGPYQGILIYQQRDAVYQPTVSITGSPPQDYDGDGTIDNKMQMTGTFYVPSAELSITGNGTGDTIGSQYISDTLKLGGNGSFTVDWNPNIIPGIREIYLVE